ncbi:hypothetical protein HPB47_005179 [Ixodes persulcatus]|uniref:Uncharacterized protein n=1 Tax=Ixodes persulcatus TaxID=34615 RepID=A0AC60PE47_IXOPE|nr:hypothetical protein HPB47_005179 [Ixodes persulcatus]
MRQLFTALVLAQLDYCSPIWNPHQLHLLAALESVQRRAAYATLKRQKHSNLARYRDTRTVDMLQVVGWLPLSLRRAVASVRLLANILRIQPDVLPGALSQNRSGIVIARTERHRQSFAVRAITHWRRLPTSLTLCPSTSREEMDLFRREVAGHLHHSDEAWAAGRRFSGHRRRCAGAWDAPGWGRAHLSRMCSALAWRVPGFGVALGAVGLLFEFHSVSDCA